ncbi:hypothetical protein VTO42DRAFT_2585 [Malbranchea cinnamomea]
MPGSLKNYRESKIKTKSPRQNVSLCRKYKKVQMVEEKKKINRQPIYMCIDIYISHSLFRTLVSSVFSPSLHSPSSSPRASPSQTVTPRRRERPNRKRQRALVRTKRNNRQRYRPPTTNSKRSLEQTAEAEVSKVVICEPNPKHKKTIAESPGSKTRVWVKGEYAEFIGRSTKKRRRRRKTAGKENWEMREDR